MPIYYHIQFVFQ